MKKKTLPKLKMDLQKIFNEYIRLRDSGKPCISCGGFGEMQAGHYYAVMGYDCLRFDEDNCWAECVRCNCFDESHLIGYGSNLINRIGIERYKALHERAILYKKFGKKWSRAEVEELIKIYKEKLKQLKTG
jgi:hypothetical protein